MSIRSVRASRSATIIGAGGNSRQRDCPITTTAWRIASDTWRERMLVSEAGKWSHALRIAMTSKEKVEIAAPILID